MNDFKMDFISFRQKLTGWQRCQTGGKKCSGPSCEERAHKDTGMNSRGFGEGPIEKAYVRGFRSLCYAPGGGDVSQGEHVVQFSPFHSPLAIPLSNSPLPAA